MRVRGLPAAIITVLVMGLAASGSARPVAAAPPYSIASDSFYRLDVPNGTLTTNVTATVLNNTNKDLTSIVLWAMPRAQNIIVKQGGAPLEIKPTQLPADGAPTVIDVRLGKPLKPRTRTELTVAYDVPPHQSEFVNMQPGVEELYFVSQGAGSFVFADVPAAAENYFDPGCLKASDQPSSVKDAGLERWICGEATTIALFKDDTNLQKRCAAADDRCRQRFFTSPFSAFAQSITDTASRGTLEAAVPLKGRTVNLKLRYFRQDQAWADREIVVAQAALPRLEALFGFSFRSDAMLMRQSHHIGNIGAAGVAFNTGGDVLLESDTGFDDEVTVHELAHQWASGTIVAAPWAAEGLAEYAVRAIAPDMGIKPIDRKWESFGYKDALSSWANGSTVGNANYWYGKAGAFFKAYEAAIGGREKMTAVLALLADDKDQWPADGRWFMNQGEWVSGQNLDALFQTWVFADTSASLLKDRRLAQDLVKAMSDRAAAAGLSGVPQDIRANLDAWEFGNIADQVKAATQLIDRYVAVVRDATAAGLGAPDAVSSAWGSKPMAQTSRLIDDQRQAVEAIANAALNLVNEAATSPSNQQLADARDKYNSGDFENAERLATLAVTRVVNSGTATRLIAAARQKQQEFHPSFLGKIGMWWTDPESALTNAESSLAAGDPDAALKQARAAYDVWNGANARGLLRLGILAASMCALSVLIWWALKRLDGSSEPAVAPGKKPAGSVSGHFLTPAEERKSSWKDWDNHNP